MATDTFDPKCHHKDFKLTRSNSIATKTTQNVATAYLSNVVNSGVHQWRFKIVKYSGGSTLDFGVWKTKHMPNMQGYMKTKDTSYAYDAGNACLEESDIDSWIPDTWGQRCKTGSVVVMTLDLNKLELRYNIDNKDYGVAYKVEKTSYRAAISIYRKDDAVQLISYSADSNNQNTDNDDVKCNECDKMKERVQSLKQQINGMDKEKNKVVQENEIITNSLQQRITELERNENMKENVNKQLKQEIIQKKTFITDIQTKLQQAIREKAEIQQKYNQNEATKIKLEQKVKRVQQKYTQLNTQNEATKIGLEQKVQRVEQEKEEIQQKAQRLEQKYNETNSLNIQLNDECKELKTDLQEMTAKYNKLYRKTNIDEGNYMNWDSDNITDWIINLDPQYEVYEEAIRVNLKKEDVDGSILGELDKNDLHRFGIISMKHKLAISKQIKRLSNKKKPPQFPQNNEGNNATDYI